ncbi:MAG: permease [Clostridia bacterium]|nr:permease [Clostridia bacterium]
MGNYRNFTLATYFVAHAAARVKREELEEQLAFMERYLRLDKVYLEPWRGELASHDQIEMIREVFHAHGIRVAGGLTTVIPTPERARPKQRLFETFCYNDAAMRKKLREVSAFIGAHFDEFIIDDFFFTNCACEDCLKARDEYNRSRGIRAGWQAYRLDLLCRVSQEDIIGPAKAANLDCKIIIKYPNWAESYQETGYNPEAQRELFDGLYTGTETRDPLTTDQHLPRYLSFSLMTYFESMWPGHNGGGWFDPFDMQVTEHYLEQAYLTAFSRPKELMMFCFQAMLNNSFTPSLGFQLDRLDALLDCAGQPQGIPCYLPDHCQGEDNVQDYLGMVGLPVVCTPYFPVGGSQLLLTRSSACDPEVLEKLDGWLRKTGGDALVTSGFWDAVRDRGMENFTSIRLTGRSAAGQDYRVEERENVCTFPKGDQPVRLPLMEFRNNATWALVKLSCREESEGILLRDPYAGGRIYSLAVPDGLPDFYRLPEPVLSRIRQELAVNGIWMEGPARISLFLYNNDTFILYPYVMEGAKRERIRLHISGAKAIRPQTGLPGQKHAKPIEPLYVTRKNEAVFDLAAVPGNYALYQILR